VEGGDNRGDCGFRAALNANGQPSITPNLLKKVRKGERKKSSIRERASGSC